MSPLNRRGTPWKVGTVAASPPQMLYQVAEDRQAYGLSGRGLALFTRASAVFTSYSSKGASSTFGSSEAFVKLQETLDEWNAAGRPDMKRLRLRLIPMSGTKSDAPDITQGKLYHRRDHWLHVWLETDSAQDNVIPD